MVTGTNLPFAGLNGTVLIDKDYWKANITANQNPLAATFAHELGNILDAHRNSGHERTYGDPANPWDDDTGDALEDCMFGKGSGPSNH